jgi:hypothetical protein
MNRPLSAYPITQEKAYVQYGFQELYTKANAALYYEQHMQEDKTINLIGQHLNEGSSLVLLHTVLCLCRKIEEMETLIKERKWEK